MPSLHSASSVVASGAPEVLLSERAFHDAWAIQTATEAVLVDESFEHFAALENHFILQLMGPLEGRRILDVGSGLGESAVYFAKQGAQVTATDVSPGMLDRCEQLAAEHGTSLETRLCPAEDLQVSKGNFDLVYGANVLHHVTDLDSTLRGVHAALKPGGHFFFWDPLAYNPAINVYRRIANRVRTPDEHPLRMSVLRDFRRYFCDVQHREFWLSALMLFGKYCLLDRIHPNEDRYWKRIYKEPASTRWWFVPLARLDEVLLRLPLLNRLAWNTVIWGRK